MKIHRSSNSLKLRKQQSNGQTSWEKKQRNIWCTIAEHTWAVLPRESKSISPGEPADVKCVETTCGVWFFAIQGEAKPPCLKLLTRNNFQKLQLRSQLMTETCGFWLDFLVSSNGFVLVLCTSWLGKKNPKQTMKTLERKQKLFQGFKYLKQLHNALSHPPNTPLFVIWICYFMQSPDRSCIYLWK